MPVFLFSLHIMKGYEGLPIALLEALSYNLPVLVSDISANREVFLREYRFFPTGNLRILKDKLSLLEQGISAEEIEEQREMLEVKYNWDQIAKAALTIYQDLMGSRGMV